MVIALDSSKTKPRFSFSTTTTTASSSFEIPKGPCTTPSLRQIRLVLSKEPPFLTTLTCVFVTRGPLLSCRSIGSCCGGRILMSSCRAVTPSKGFLAIQAVWSPSLAMISPRSPFLPLNHSSFFHSNQIYSDICIECGLVSVHIR